MGWICADFERFFAALEEENFESAKWQIKKQKVLTNASRYGKMNLRGTTAPGDGTHHKKRANRYGVRHTAPVLQHETGGDTHWKKTEIEKPRHPRRRRLCR